MFGPTPGAARIALPESVASPSEFRFGINVEPPTTSESKTRSKAASRVSTSKDDDRATARGDVPAVSAPSS